MWDVGLQLSDTDSSLVVARGNGVGVEGVLTYGDRKWFDYRWWAHSAIYRSSIIEMYTLKSL